MKSKDSLFSEAINSIKELTPHKKSILYHNIYSLKESRGYHPFASEEDVDALVKFLNSYR